jgi:hypothetical protein
MRIIALALISLFCTSCASIRQQAVTSVDILEIKPRYIQAEDFKRIREYLTGKEEKGNRVILRTNPEQREGYYFTLVLDQKLRNLPTGTVIFGEFHTPKSLEVQQHTFKLPAKLGAKTPNTREIFIGLTGDDWPVKEAVPSAWRFTIKDASGEVLGIKKSFLWSL